MIFEKNLDDEIGLFDLDTLPGQSGLGHLTARAQESIAVLRCQTQLTKIQKDSDVTTV